ncbi:MULTISPECIES: phosphoadenosine phosphosulfate reductase family protein [Parabacteroides]|uniref:phosphoadenosine phosphosulfate reductase family protein n=1 Tax=Parabacteroides TaxID=375288 RepID=UPI000EFEB4B3|nr:MULTISPECIES: phosphoadenosine phosphosulfate reductase family protein [Parabacteroides]RHU24288.1 sulfate adenylate transferase [Parabacteroides sp. TM07-1AC]
MKIIVSFSGGKDSQACLIQAANRYGADKIEAVFCDTGWEHPDTYQHITNVCQQMSIKLTTLKPELGFVELAKKKKRFPSVIGRFCTIELKIKPMIDYLLSLKESCIIIQGIRARESSVRAAMEPECMYFRSYFQPNGSGRKETYRGKEVREWCSKYDASVIRPIFNWSAQEVIDCILNAEQKPNPLYYKGFSRVGCFPCVMCRQVEIRELLKDELMKQRLIDAEKYVGRSFFAIDTIPKRFCKNGVYAMAEEVFKYVSDKNATLDMFGPEGGYACMSIFHGLCE